MITDLFNIKYFLMTLKSLLIIVKKSMTKELGKAKQDNTLIIYFVIVNQNWQCPIYFMCKLLMLIKYMFLSKTQNIKYEISSFRVDCCTSNLWTYKN